MKADATRRARASGTGQSSAASRFRFEPALVMRSCSDELFNVLLDWCRDASQAVLSEMWAADVDLLCGERWKPRLRSKVARAGWCRTDIVLGNKRITVRRPRVRSAQGREVDLPTFKAASATDFLSREVIEDACAMVTTGSFPEARYPRGPVHTTFTDQLVSRLGVLHATPKGEFDPGLLISSVTLPDQSFLGALGIDAAGRRRLVGLASGSPGEQSQVEALLGEVVVRHVRKVPPSICFVGESLAVREAVRNVFGQSVILQRCPWEKRRHTVDRVPPAMQPGVLEELLAAHALPEARAARRALEQVAQSLEGSCPEAASTLREGLEETLALHKLGGESGRDMLVAESTLAVARGGGNVGESRPRNSAGGVSA